MHWTQEHAPMPNATAGLRPTGHFLHCVSEGRVCSLPEGGPAALGVSEGPGQLPQPQRAPRRKALQSSVYIISSASQPAGALMLVTMTSVATVCGSLGTQQAPCSAIIFNWVHLT